MLHQLLFGDLPEDSRAYPSEERIKAFHVKLDVFLAVANYGERPAVQQLALWDMCGCGPTWRSRAPARWPRQGFDLLGDFRTMMGINANLPGTTVVASAGARSST